VDWGVDLPIVTFVIGAVKIVCGHINMDVKSLNGFVIFLLWQVESFVFLPVGKRSKAFCRTTILSDEKI
jgi:hypothetical protein